ncbi:hypothetical protein KOW79_021215 [Hemibagrus wyckioides]|uniref:Uncharacterized protein n=1 Tax=Hemibagrus wyckioides TaxID=337641 RepID=A0A9D3S904_9TELE|nr:hypothetical protein KOW79_021215 [Hemibagrus wyckioides]
MRGSHPLPLPCTSLLPPFSPSSPAPASHQTNTTPTDGERTSIGRIRLGNIIQDWPTVMRDFLRNPDFPSTILQGVFTGSVADSLMALHATPALPHTSRVQIVPSECQSAGILPSSVLSYRVLPLTCSHCECQNANDLKKIISA